MDRVNIKIDTAKMPYTSSIFNKSQLVTNGNETKQTENESSPCQVDISANGKRRAENANDYKKSGVTSAREVWEDSTKELKKTSRLTGPYADTGEIMRYLEPETYKEWMDLNYKYDETLTYTNPNNGMTTYKDVHSDADLSEEGRKYLYESFRVLNDFLDRYYSKYNNAQNIENTISELEGKYSDSIHNVTFNLDSGNNYAAEDMWRFNSKYSVMITKNMLDTMMNKSDDYDKLTSFIDESVQNMKQAELNYEGNLDWLRFGVKLDDDWKATYYADFTGSGCRKKGGIQANSADELLQMLMNYDIE